MQARKNKQRSKRTQKQATKQAAQARMEEHNHDGAAQGKAKEEKAKHRCGTGGQQRPRAGSRRKGEGDGRGTRAHARQAQADDDKTLGPVTGLQGGPSKRRGCVSGPPHACTTPLQLMSLQHLKELCVPHSKLKLPSPNSTVEKSYERANPKRSLLLKGLKLPIMATSSWHLRPFQCLKMIPGCGSISQVSRL